MEKYVIGITPLLLLVMILVMCDAACDLNAFISSAEVIIMDNCEFASSDVTQLSRFTNVVELSMQSNHLTTFPNVSASANTLLRLNLEENQIGDILDDMIQKLIKLEYLNLKGNNLTVFPYVSTAVSSLTDIYLDENRIVDIEDYMLRPLTNLDTLSLTTNRLTIFPNVFASGSTLRNLYLIGNQISVVKNEVLRSLTNLQLLSLSSNLVSENRITSFPDMSASGSTLNHLFLEGNQIAEIPSESLIPLKNLVSLSLTSNLLTRFPNVSSVGSTLTHLYLGNNRIGEVEEDVLKSLQKLQILDLSRNLFISFPDLSPLGATLTWLHLYFNQISTIKEESLMSLVHLENLYMNSNPFTRFPHIVDRLPKLTFLTVQDTGLTAFPPVLRNLSQLELTLNVDICRCENAWLKQENANFKTVTVTDMECGDKYWSQMSLEEINRKCTRERTNSDKILGYARELSKPRSLASFLLNKHIKLVSAFECARRCLHKTGCVSFYWHPAASNNGDCVLIAPGDSSIRLDSIEGGDLDVWLYYALT